MRYRIVIAGVLSALIAAPASAELVDSPSGGFVTRHAVTIAADPQSVWNAVSVPSDWWDGTHSFSGDAENLTLEPRAGGCFCEMLPAGEARASPGSVQHMQVVFADPGHALRMIGGLGPLQSEPVNAVLTITMKAADGGTRVLFEYVVGGYMRYETGTIAPAVDQVIGEQLAGLANLLGRAGKSAGSTTPPATDEGPEPEAAAGPAQAGGGLSEDFLSAMDAEQVADADAATAATSDTAADDEPRPIDGDIATDETYSR